MSWPSLSTIGWNRKPHASAGLNWQWPIASFLRYAFAFNLGGGTTMAGRYPGPTGPSPAAPLGAATFGAGATWGAEQMVNFNDGTTAFVDCGADASITAAYSVVCRWKLASAADALYTLFGSNTSGGDERRQGSLYIENSAASGNTPKLAYWRQPSAVVVYGTTTIEAGRYYTAGLTVTTANGGVCTVYLDGKPDGVETVNTIFNNNNSPGNLRIGFAGAYTGAPFNGLFDYFYLFRGLALSDQQHAFITRDPWAMWQSPQAPVVFAATPPTPPAGGNPPIGAYASRAFAGGLPLGGFR